jgi:hypothetical protein
VTLRVRPAGRSAAPFRTAGSSTFREASRARSSARRGVPSVRARRWSRSKTGTWCRRRRSDACGTTTPAPSPFWSSRAGSHRHHAAFTDRPQPPDHVIELRRLISAVTAPDSRPMKSSIVDSRRRWRPPPWRGASSRHHPGGPTSGDEDRSEHLRRSVGNRCRRLGEHAADLVLGSVRRPRVQRPMPLGHPPRRASGGSRSVAIKAGGHYPSAGGGRRLVPSAGSWHCRPPISYPKPLAESASSSSTG